MWKLVYVLAALALANPAAADWQYTRWGMSPAEVIAASKGAAMSATADEQAKKRRDGWTPSAAADYTAGNLPFRAFFYFRNGKLDLVLLELADASRRIDALSTLQGQYGAAVDATKGSTFNSYKWRSPEAGNLVQAVDLFAINSFTVSYSPIGGGL